MISLPYTICFCLCSDQVLMLYRNNPPNANHWNGLGGKIEAGETPLKNIHREMMEEAEIDLHQAQELRFAGLVTWTDLHTHMSSKRGMYAFLARLTPDFPIRLDCPTPEGLLSWKRLDWVCDRSNLAVVENIPHFLPQMLTDPKPQEYCCSYQEGILQAVARGALPIDWRNNEVFH
jgi:8-oxo-dGTP diphosphatase